MKKFVGKLVTITNPVPVVQLFPVGRSNVLIIEHPKVSLVELQQTYLEYRRTGQIDIIHKIETTTKARLVETSEEIGMVVLVEEPVLIPIPTVYDFIYFTFFHILSPSLGPCFLGFSNAIENIHITLQR